MKNACNRQNCHSLFPLMAELNHSLILPISHKYPLNGSVVMCYLEKNNCHSSHFFGNTHSLRLVQNQHKGLGCPPNDHLTFPYKIFCSSSPFASIRHRTQTNVLTPPLKEHIEKRKPQYPCLRRAISPETASQANRVHNFTIVCLCSVTSHRSHPNVTWPDELHL